MSRLCSRPGCSSAASATMSYEYASRTVWLDDLRAELDLPLWLTASAEIPLWIGLIGTVVWACRTKGSGSLRRDFGLAMQWSDIPLGLVAGFVGQIAIVAIVIPIYRLLGIDTDEVG